MNAGDPPHFYAVGPSGTETKYYTADTGLGRSTPVTMNKFVACTPFPKQSIEKVMKGGILMVDKKVNLQELTLVFPTKEGLKAGRKVWVRGDAAVQPWVKEVFTINGSEFILVPENFIVVYE